jgi:hypothetical protein
MDENEEELLGIIEGLTNWMSALQTLVENTDCNPDNPDEFDEILLCCSLQQAQGEIILKKYGFRK